MKRFFCSSSARWLKLLLFFGLAGLTVEVCFHLFLFDFAQGLAFSALCGALLGCVLALFVLFLPELIGKIIASAMLLICGVFSCTQLVYFRVFGNLMQLSLIRMGGDVFANFGSIIADTMLGNWFELLILLLPFVLSVILTVRTRRTASRTTWRQRAAAAGVTVFLALLTLGAGFCSPSGARPAWNVLTSGSVTTEYAYQRLGFAGGSIKDLASGLIVSDEVGYAPGIEESVPPEQTTEPTQPISDTLTVDGYDMEQYNVLDIDFASLAASTDDETLKALDAYFSSVSPTAKNAYTGLLSGYNLITICAESFTPYLISEELTPTLYRLSTNGMIFENYYGTYQSLTSNGEYTFCTGLYPNMLTTSAATSFEDSIRNYLPFCLGNCLSDLGYRCYAFHNNVGEFYSRNLSHPNMGYRFYSAGDGLDIELLNPSSDEDMFAQSVTALLSGEEPFHAYYMTWSGHNPYNWNNAMSARNKEAVADLPYSDAVKAFLACNLELEYGLTALLDELTRAGVADKTVIVLTNDHFPYGLTEDQYNELAGDEIDTTFEKYRNAFLCYIPGLEENIVVEEYCSTADILPTLLNLFGVSYDSRLLAGRDVLSDGIHVAVLASKSFVTDTFAYDTASGASADSTQTDARGYTQEDYLNYINNLFAVSADVLASNYYAHIFSVESSGSAESELVSFTDIQNVFHKSAVQYVVKNDLMQPESEELFGGEQTATVGELCAVFARLAGEEAEDALAWATEQGIVADDATADTPLTHVTCALYMARFAETMGSDISGEEVSPELYPELDEESLHACLWATGQAVINKTMDFVYENRAVPLTRFQLAAYVSYLCTHALDR